MKRNIITLIRSIKYFALLALNILFNSGKEEKLTKFGTKFRKYFEQTSGVFIKFGQILSLRKDMIPIEICEILLSIKLMFCRFLIFP
jgi:predicted unusual protein kinase regulating ubiquinone biosynthesis (AarF/ABC1/UbiB family)